MKTKKRFLSVLLALCLCIGLLPMSALAADVPTEPNTTDTNGVTCNGEESCTHQAAIGDVHYNLLTDAYAALPRNNSSTPTTIHLPQLRGGSMGSDGTDVGMNYVIDFGGYTYTVGKEMVGSTGYKNQGIRVLKGSTAVFKNGTLKAANDAGFMQVMHTYGNVTLEDFTLDATLATNAMAYEADNGTLDILGNSSILASSGHTGLYVAFWPRGGYPDGTTVTVDTTGTITGALTYEWDDKDTTTEQQTENKAVLNIKNGTFDFSKIDTLFTSSLPANLKVPKINITGGTFAVDVSDYVATGYECKKLTNNQFVVQERVGSLVVNPETAADGSVSATLEGTFVPDAQIEDNVKDSDDGSQTGVSGYEITVDLSTGSSETETGSTTLNVTPATAKSLSDASSLTLQTNAGTVELDARALDRIASASGVWSSP